MLEAAWRSACLRPSAMRPQAGPHPHGLLSTARALFVTLLQLRQPEVTRRLPEWSGELAPPAPQGRRPRPSGAGPKCFSERRHAGGPWRRAPGSPHETGCFFDAYRVARGRDIGRGAYFGYVRLSPSPLDDWPPRDDVVPGGRNLAVITGRQRWLSSACFRR